MKDDLAAVAMPWILEAEGGYVNDPHDPGGETHWGISRRAHPEVDIRSLTVEGAREIYRQFYWMPLQCERLPLPLAVAVFDAGVNQGVAAAARLFQRALHVAADGVIGPHTIDAARTACLEAVLPELLSLRAEAYRQTPHADRYFRGWAKRLFRLHLTCLRLAAAGHGGRRDDR